jgi:hypothetical protein
MPKNQILTKEQFIQQWLIAFTAAYAAKHYDENCYKGWGSEEKFIHPEDAHLLAKEAYKLYYNEETKHNGWDELYTLKKAKD